MSCVTQTSPGLVSTTPLLEDVSACCLGGVTLWHACVSTIVELSVPPIWGVDPREQGRFLEPAQEMTISRGVNSPVG